MSNHGKHPFDNFSGAPDARPDFQERNELMRGLLLDTTGFCGALGEFPEPKLTKEDEGAIQFAIGERDGKVVVDFGTPVHWLGMTPQQAAELASLILKKARLVARKNGESVGFVL